MAQWSPKIKRRWLFQWTLPVFNITNTCRLSMEATQSCHVEYPMVVQSDGFIVSPISHRSMSCSMAVQFSRITAIESAHTLITPLATSTYRLATYSWRILDGTFALKSTVNTYISTSWKFMVCMVYVRCFERGSLIFRGRLQQAVK